MAVERVVEIEGVGSVRIRAIERSRWELWTSQHPEGGPELVQKVFLAGLVDPTPKQYAQWMVDNCIDPTGPDTCFEAILGAICELTSDEEGDG